MTDPTPTLRGALVSPEAQRQFLLAGNAVFTVVSRKTGTRFTFKVYRPEETVGEVSHVLVLTGPDNSSSYSYLGTIRDRANYSHGQRSRIGEASPAAGAARWVCTRLLSRKDLPNTDFFHEGRCGRCGRRLTVPESIATGFGPECATLLPK